MNRPKTLGEYVVEMDKKRFINVSCKSDGRTYSTKTAVRQGMFAPLREERRTQARKLNADWQKGQVRTSDLRIDLDKFGQRTLFYRGVPALYIGHPQYLVAESMQKKVANRLIGAIRQAQTLADLRSLKTRIKYWYGFDREKDLILGFNKKLSDAIREAYNTHPKRTAA